MALEFHTAEPQDVERLAEALIEAFGVPPDADCVRRELLQWKYFEPGPEWPASRSYVLLKDGVIKAHCGVWPMNLEFHGDTLSCICFADWTSARELPGVGVVLKRKLMKLADLALVIGGSPDTRAVVPRIGFKEVGRVSTFVTVVRPWRQHATRPREALPKAAARLLRNSVWSLGRKDRVPEGWRASRFEAFDARIKVPGVPACPTPKRSAEYLNYWLRLPVAEISGFSIVHRDKPVGYFLLTRVKGQTRIADVRLWTGKEEDWCFAYGLATQEARADSETCEILAIASTPFAEHALRANGYRDRGSEPIYLYDPHQRLAHAPGIFLNLIDGDGAYLYDADHPFSS
jgi:hypothetical protein